MLYSGISKSDIEKELQRKGDFVQIAYLTDILEEKLPIDIKKFICFKLAGIYEKKFMFKDAAKMFDHVAFISIAFSEKIKYHIKEAELYIKEGDFELVDHAMKKAMSDANASEKAEIYFIIKNSYNKQAEIYEKEMRRNRTVKIYEKLLHMDLSELEKNDIKAKLLVLYEKLGRLKEYFALKHNIEDKK